ncbi:chemotaxis protein CheW [Arenibaculum pallidiluteum]|uniref:chemotaxis protein CheW n=1 Tax=Arenibaculum pallidiluteum TaxID=2812559 RepID=UPI001A97C1EC|nr:chemotaxis protein CheW [Arenibaculum pallidiluteum]
MIRSPAQEGGPEDLALAALLRRRAERLAAPRIAEAPRAGGSVLSFGIGPETYAIALGSLTEAAALEGCAAVPGWPPELLGVVNRRGTLVPVLDLRRVLGLPEPAEPGAVLFLRGVRTIGLRVDALGEVRQVPDEAVADPPEAAGPLVAGVSSDGLILLDVRRILALPLFGPADGPIPDRDMDRTR